jgi:hypothetical protein
MPGIAMRPRPNGGQGWRKGGDLHYEKQISFGAPFSDVFILFSEGKKPYSPARIQVGKEE